MSFNLMEEFVKTLTPQQKEYFASHPQELVDTYMAILQELSDPELQLTRAAATLNKILSTDKHGVRRRYLE